MVSPTIFPPIGGVCGYQLLLSELLCLQALRSTVNIRLSYIPEIN
jgi:hypothetical protein